MNQSSQDKVSVWAENTVMREKTQAYQKRALKALGRGIIHPNIRHPWKGDGYHGESRMRIFELDGINTGSQDGPPPQFHTAQDLLKYWEKTTPSDGTQTSRRVIILEDMNMRMIELLGVLLDIPPEFFLAHCSSRMDLGIVDRSGAKKGSSVYWSVEVPQRR